MIPLALELLEVGVRLGGVSVLAGINLQLRSGEFLSIVGPSGSGKTTLLKVISGIVPPSEGEVRYWDGQNGFVGGEGGSHGHVVMVWQSLALFPHLNVEENIAFGLRVRGTAVQARTRRVAEMLELVGLPELGLRRVQDLSGGERQRVALARALIVHPEVVLLDEPLGSLDEDLRVELLGKIRELHRSSCATFVMVTHNQEEAVLAGSRILVLNRGRIEQLGNSSDVLVRPSSAFVAKFIGKQNVLRGAIVRMEEEKAWVRTAGGVLVGVVPEWMVANLRIGQEVGYVLLRERIRIGEAGENSLAGLIEACINRGERRIVEVRITGIGLIRCEIAGASLESANGYPLTDQVAITWDASDAYVLPL